MKHVRNIAMVFSCLLLASLASADDDGVKADEYYVQVEEYGGTTRWITTQSWDGAALPAYPEGTPELHVVRANIPPGAKIALHKHPVMSMGLVTRGTLTVHTEDGKTMHLKAGHAAAEVVETWHHGENLGDEPVQIIVFYANVKDAPTRFEK